MRGSLLNRLVFKAVCRTATDLTIRDIGSVIFLFGPENCEACKSRCKFRSDSFWGVSPSLHNYGRGDPGVYLQNCTVLQQQIKFLHNTRNVRAVCLHNEIIFANIGVFLLIF